MTDAYEIEYTFPSGEQIEGTSAGELEELLNAGERANTNPSKVGTWRVRPRKGHVTKCRLVFADWRDRKTGASIYNTEAGFELSVGFLHAGTSFPVEVTFLDTPYIAEEIAAAMKERGAFPVFDLIVEDET